MRVDVAKIVPSHQGRLSPARGVGARGANVGGDRAAGKGEDLEVLRGPLDGVDAGVRSAATGAALVLDGTTLVEPLRGRVLVEVVAVVGEDSSVLIGGIENAGSVGGRLVGVEGSPVEGVVVPVLHNIQLTDRGPRVSISPAG